MAISKAQAEETQRQWEAAQRQWEHAERQQREHAERQQRVDVEAMERLREMQGRYARLLDTWEAQARRFDAILKKWEERG